MFPYADALLNLAWAVVCLAAVIRGETGHYDHVAGGVTSGVAAVALEFTLPVIFRAKGKG